MKTNEWLATFVAENKADLTALITNEAVKANIQTNAVDLAPLLGALESDFEAESFQATAAAFSVLSTDTNAIKILWSQVEQKLIAYISGEAEMSGGAKRLAYLRLSTFTQELNSAWG